MISLNFSDLQLQLRHQENRTTVFCPVRKKWILLSPEEHVRQYILQYLISQEKYPLGMIAVERKIVVGKQTKRFDIVVFNRQHKPWLLAELKNPEVAINEQTLFQLLNYHQALPSNYWLLSNGHQTFCADATNKLQVVWLDKLPTYNF
ncbi:MAG: type I restriction enzyme HsdR N-terminal domain-containing protein [Bacteroidetes bacterium]|nr:type I restriction enzyme HsdR N-terminal domain-containing protein [Bacteroidota bacterium]